METKFPLSQPQIIGEQNQKDFIALFGAILRMRNLLSSFDDFTGKELISERDLQDYLSRYQDLRDEWRPRHGVKEDISDDIIFERRHILEHNNGLVDQKYLDKSNDMAYTVGQRIVVKETDAYTLLEIVRKLGDALSMVS